MGQGMGIGAGGAGGMASEMAMGLAIAQQMMHQHGGQLIGGTGVPPAGAGGAATAAAAAGSPSEVLTPAQVASILKVEEPDVVGLLESGELAAKKIGANWRIRRAALDAYLAN